MKAKKKKTYTVYVVKEFGRPVYIGCTSLSLNERLKLHFKDYSKYNNEKNHGNSVLFTPMRNVGYEHFSIEPLVSNVVNKTEAERLEVMLTKQYAEKYPLYNLRAGNECADKTVNAKPVRCIETGEEFYSMSEAERQLGISHSTISNCCKGKRKSAGKYHWEYCA